MARQVDVMKVRKDMEALVEEARGIQTKYQGYAQEVGETIKGMLEEAGIFEPVNKLELERQEANKAAQEKLDAIQTKLNELNTVLRYLEGNLDPEDAAPPAEEAKAEEAPVEEPEASAEDADAKEEAPVEDKEEAPVEDKEEAPVEEAKPEATPDKTADAPSTPTQPQF